MASVAEPRSLTVGGTFTDAFGLYRLLFQRSVTAAAVVYASIALLELARHAVGHAAAAALGLVVFVATTAGPLLVQGALVEIVRNLHEGRAAEKIGELFASSRERLWRLFGASVLYAFGVIFFAIFLIVPGLLVAARWSLLAPLVMLEGRTVGEARLRSTELVKGHTGKVLACIVLAYALDGWVFWTLLFAHLSFGTETFLSFLWSALSAPFQAHVLTVLYYRLAEPEKGVVDPAVLSWRSVWEGR